MGISESLKRLFGTTKEVGKIKLDEIKDKSSVEVDSAKDYMHEATEKIEEAVVEIKESAKVYAEKVQDYGQELVEKAKEKVDEIDVKVAGKIDKLEEKIRKSNLETKEPDDAKIDVVPEEEAPIAEATVDENKKADKQI